MNNFVNYLCNNAIKVKVIKPDERNLYEYAFGLLISCVYTWGTFILLGLFFRALPVAISFMIFFIPLRIFCGGLHKESYSKCYVSSVYFFLVIFLISKAPGLEIINKFFLCLLPLTIWIIYKFSPIEDVNKPLGNYEIRMCSKKSKTILAVGSAIIFLLWISHTEPLILYFSIAGLDMVGLLMLLKILKK
jgi:accessory gene regulator B